MKSRWLCSLLTLFAAANTFAAEFPQPKPSEKPANKATSITKPAPRKKEGGGTVGSGNDGLILRGTGSDCDGCDQPPRNPTKLTFDQTEALFHSAPVAPSEADLTGEWKPTLIVSAPGMHEFGIDPPDEATPEWGGGKLRFKKTTGEWVDSSSFVATLPELQAPSNPAMKVNFTASEACFSPPVRFAYGGTVEGAYYLYQCRILPRKPAKAAKMICEVSPRGTLPHPDDQLWTNRTSLYLGYTKSL